VPHGRTSVPEINQRDYHDDRHDENFDQKNVSQRGAQIIPKVSPTRFTGAQRIGGTKEYNGDG